MPPIPSRITTMVDMTSGYHKLGITVRQRYCSACLLTTSI